MEMLPVTPERKAELDDYAYRHGKDSATALDEALACFLGWERQDYQDSVEAIRLGYEDVKAGRTRPATEFVEELRKKHDFRVSISQEAEREGDLILEWLLSHHAGETGLRWLRGLEKSHRLAR